MIRSLLASLLLGAACASDVSIMKNTTTEPSDETASPQDLPAPTDEPAEEPEDTMTDMTIGFGEIHFRQIACPACVGEPSEFDITANLALHYPTSGTYTDWLTPVGTCVTDIFETHVSTQPLTATQSATFRPNVFDSSISLSPSGQGEWTNQNILEYQYERSARYTVVTEHGTIDSAFESIEGFDSIEPYTLLWIDPSYAFEAVISKTGTSFTWSPVVSNSQFEILIAVYSPDGSQLLGLVSCMEDDVGYMAIPGTYFQSYPYWSLASVHLIRHRTGRVPVVDLNGYFESHMQWEVVGTGHVE